VRYQAHVYHEFRPPRSDWTRSLPVEVAKQLITQSWRGNFRTTLAVLSSGNQYRKFYQCLSEYSLSDGTEALVLRVVSSRRSGKSAHGLSNYNGTGWKLEQLLSWNVLLIFATLSIKENGWNGELIQMSKNWYQIDMRFINQILWLIFSTVLRTLFTSFYIAWNDLTRTWITIGH